MKILRIGIYNINSLVGYQEIDFRTEPLRSAGLYAIVGPTGSGKSTILDAVTLALYGKTERDGTGAEVMSHGTGECFTEVEYQANGGTYLSRWERRRARQRPDGNLQTAQRQLSRWNADAGEYQPMDADRLAEVNSLTEEVIGLDYDRFVRSVMLTQGQFARFLHSSLKERADVLEKITGTEIYSRISEAAFLRHKVARTHYDRLKESQGHTLPLPDDERASLETDLATVKEGARHLRPRQQQVRKGLAVYTKRDDLLLREEELRQQAERTREAARNLEPVQKALQESLRLLPLRGPLARLQELRQSAAAMELELERLHAREKLAAGRVVQDRVAWRTAEVAQADFIAARSGKLEALRKATELENSALVLEREMDLQALSLARAKTGKEETHAQLVAGRKQLHELVAELGTDDAASVGEQLEQSEAALERLRQEHARLDNWKRRLGIEERLGGLTAEESVLAAKLASAREWAERAQRRAGEAESGVESRRRMLRQVEQSKGLEQLRAETRPGEPCLLCGSVHHPALEDHQPVTDDDVLVARRDLEEAQTKLETARQEGLRAARELQSVSTDLAVCKSTLGQLRKELEGIAVSGERPAAYAAVLQRVSELTEAMEQYAETCRQLRRKRSGVEAFLRLQPRVQALEEAFTEREAGMQQLEAEAGRRAREVARLTERQEDLIGPGTTQTFRSALEHSEAAIRASWSAARQALEKAQGELHLADELVASGQGRLEALQHTQAAVVEEVNALLGQLDVETAAAAAATLLDPAREESYRNRLREVDVQQQAQTTARAEWQREFSSLETAVADLLPRTTLEEELERLEAEASRLDQERGGIEKLIEQDEQRRSVHALLLDELGKSEQELGRWARLNDLIGQQSGVKFSRFAQTLTLQRLVAVGNMHLQRISERYRMRHKAAAELGKENLELEIIDTYQNDNRRPMATLSGGETFLVSLALALGLSELASGRTTIQSLFIDEGFGTLDERVLDQAVSALEQLEHQGKTIGLISHVRELRERIHCKIQLSARGNGRSQLEVTAG